MKNKYNQSFAPLKLLSTKTTKGFCKTSLCPNDASSFDFKVTVEGICWDLFSFPFSFSGRTFKSVNFGEIKNSLGCRHEILSGINGLVKPKVVHIISLFLVQIVSMFGISRSQYALSTKRKTMPCLEMMKKKKKHNCQN